MNTTINARSNADHVLSQLAAVDSAEMDSILAKLDGELGAPGRDVQSAQMLPRDCTVTCLITCYGITSF